MPRVVLTALLSLAYEPEISEKEEFVQTTRRLTHQFMPHFAYI